jgi:hypothetical protein
VRVQHLALIATLTMGMGYIGAGTPVAAATPPATATPDAGAPTAEEPTAETCRAAVASARALADALPAEDLTRRVAESHLVQAMVEAGNGEFDDCLDMARHATVEIRERRHRSVPGPAGDDRRDR